MKRRPVALAVALIAAAVTFGGCEWSGGSDNGFNTSRAGLDVTITGFYVGTLSGGNVVAPKSGAPIRTLTILQTGNAIEVTDSNGQKYRGTAGSPGALIDLNSVTGVIPSGVNLVQYQIFFSGTDGVAAKEIEFTGIIDVVTVTDVKGDATSVTITQGATADSTTGTTADSGTTSDSSLTVSTTGTSSTTGGETTSTDPGSGDVTGTGAALDTTTTATQTSNAGTTSNSGNTSATTTTATAGNDSTRTITTTFELTEANTQFRLRGTWIEAGGLVGQVEGRATGAGRLVNSNTESVEGTPAVDTTNQ